PDERRHVVPAQRDPPRGHPGPRTRHPPGRPRPDRALGETAPAGPRPVRPGGVAGPPPARMAARRRRLPPVPPPDPRPGVPLAADSVGPPRARRAGPRGRDRRGGRPRTGAARAAASPGWGIARGSGEGVHSHRPHFPRGSRRPASVAVTGAATERTERGRFE